MSKYNEIKLIGNVGKPADVKEITDVGTVARFPIGVYRCGKGDTKKTDWFYIEAWHDTARVAETLAVGAQVVVIGLMKHDVKDNGNGRSDYYNVVADFIGLVPPADKEDTGDESWQ